MLDESDLVVLALTSRVVPSAVPPLSAREFWPLVRATDVVDLQGRSASALTADLSITTEVADRIVSLLDRGRGLALAVEQLEHTGIWTLAATGEHYPRRLRDRLGDGAPPMLHGVGDMRLLQRDGIGVVGSGDATATDALVRAVVSASIRARLPILSGAAQGADQHAIDVTVDGGGWVVGVVAESLERAVARPTTRQAVMGGQLCLVTPYAPAASFSEGNAAGRSKVIYALARCVVVVGCEVGGGEAWAGATEAIDAKVGRVVAWAGDGASAGNRALVTRGAEPLTGLDTLDAVVAQELAEKPGSSDSPGGDQLSFF